MYFAQRPLQLQPKQHSTIDGDGCCTMDDAMPHYPDGGCMDENGSMKALFCTLVVVTVAKDCLKNALVAANRIPLYAAGNNGHSRACNFDNGVDAALVRTGWDRSPNGLTFAVAVDAVADDIAHCPLE